MSEPTLMAACADHGLQLNAADYETCERLFDGTLLRALLALLQKDAPLLLPIMPQLLAMIASGQYLAALMLIITTLASGTPAP